MDGGNYANNGFSPPNYSALERWICDWYDYKELTASTTISGMPAWDSEPVAYIIRNDDNPEEYYILENRQQRGFDFYVPGNGLLVTHVSGYTKGNLFPNVLESTRIRLIYADNRNYRELSSERTTTSRLTATATISVCRPFPTSSAIPSTTI